MIRNTLREERDRLRAELRRQRGSIDWWLEQYRLWPRDVRQKLSLHDVRRMADAAGKPEAAQ